LLKQDNYSFWILAIFSRLFSRGCLFKFEFFISVLILGNFSFFLFSDILRTGMKTLQSLFSVLTCGNFFSILSLWIIIYITLETHFYILWPLICFSAGILVTFLIVCANLFVFSITVESQLFRRQLHLHKSNINIVFSNISLLEKSFFQQWDVRKWFFKTRFFKTKWKKT
jgi:hypothetical protein